MMGWRCGYIAYPTPEAGGPPGLFAALQKIQDTIPICPSQASAFPRRSPLSRGARCPKWTAHLNRSSKCSRSTFQTRRCDQCECG